MSDVHELAKEYLRAVDEAEAAKEEVLASWAERYYRPGYLDDEEWELLKELVEAGRFDDAETVVGVAVYRKLATEHGLDVDGDDWPAKEASHR